MIIINDDDTCLICGAYFQGNGYCCNGHSKQKSDIAKTLKKWEHDNLKP